ncbi:MAG: GNAT family N-acetyltransferase [Acidimicrobiales bacterium]
MKLSASAVPTVLERIGGYVRRYAEQQREVERTGPFLATFGRHSNGPYLNYAVPDDGAVPTRTDIERLVSLYEERDLRPRVELVRSLSPSADFELRQSGFELDGSFPLMACTSESMRQVVHPGSVRIVLGYTKNDIRGILEVRRQVFEEPDRVTQAEVTRTRYGIDSGAIAAMAVDSSTGEGLGSGESLVPYDGVTELTSIGVLESHRRRGIGASLTAALTRAALAAGADIVYLTAANEEGARIYDQVGYLLVGEFRHLGYYKQTLASDEPT